METNKNLERLVNDLIIKSQKDIRFKTDLMKDPLNTIEKFTNYEIKLNKDTKVVIEDQSNNNHIYLNIPREPDFESLQLTEEELENVAGGVASTPICAGFAAGVAASLAANALYDFATGYYNGIKDRLR